MTVAMLLENTLISAKRFFDRSRSRSIQPLPLNLVEPVPSDIDIAVSQEPRNVQEICQELGLSGNEVHATALLFSYTCCHFFVTLTKSRINSTNYMVRPRPKLVWMFSNVLITAKTVNTLL